MRPTTVDLFRRSSAEVVIDDISEEGLRAAARRLDEGTAGKLFALPRDSSDPSACTDAVAFSPRRSIQPAPSSPSMAARPLSDLHAMKGDRQ
jgi:hypothetical protein